MFVLPLAPTGHGFQTWFILGNKTAALPLVLFLNAGFVEVNFHRQRPRLLALLRFFHGHSDHRTQVVRVDFVDIIQKLFISVDTQLRLDVLLWCGDEAGTAEPQHDHDGQEETRR